MQPRSILLLVPALAIVLLAPHATFAAPPGSAAPAGIVLQASHARVASSAAETGLTVYDGDVLETEKSGNLQVRLGGSQAYLLENSTARMQQLDASLGATLERGEILMSSQDGATFRLLVDGATIQPATSRRTVAQVTLVSSKELLLLASKGSLQVTMGEESKTLPEGNSVRMMITPDAAAPAPEPQVAAWSSTMTYNTGDVVSYNGVLYASLVNNNLGHQPGARSNNFWNRGGRAGGRQAGAGGPGAGGRNGFFWVAIGLVGAGVATALALALITNDDP